MRQLCKGNVAVVKAAVMAGCRAYYGYPITPASEIAEYASLLIPQVGGTFIQAESEVSAINMVYGAASAGMRVMSASSGPGLSLMQEGLSYMAGAELPCVVVDVMRAGPGLGNIGPEQSDYFCVTKGGGHGCYRNLVLAPSSAQEMASLTMLAFELADKYRNPAVVLTDGFVGQMMEPIELEMANVEMPDKPWAVRGDAETRKNVISSIFLDFEVMEKHILKLDAKYKRMQEEEVRYETYMAEDADILLVGYGIVSRVLRSAVDQARAQRAEGRALPSHHPVPVPVAGAGCRRQELRDGHGGGDEHRSNGRGRSAGGFRQRSGRILWPVRRLCALGRGSLRSVAGARDGAGLSGKEETCERLTNRQSKTGCILRSLPPQGRKPAPDALLSRLRSWRDP